MLYSMKESPILQCYRLRKSCEVCLLDSTVLEAFLDELLKPSSACDRRFIVILYDAAHGCFFTFQFFFLVMILYFLVICCLES